MDKRKERKLSTGVLDLSSERTQGLGDSVSQSMTLTQPNTELEWSKESISDIKIEYHMTIEITNSSLSRKQLSLLLGVLNFQAVYYGVNLNMVLALWELYFRLLGNKSSSKEIREPQIRLCLTVTEAILKFFKGSSFSGASGEYLQIPEHIKVILGKGLMSKRTYRSRFSCYRPEALLRIKIVPVDIQFLKRRKDSIPYSGYCKGYGESHPSARKLRTKPSAELDGDKRTPEQIEDRKISEMLTDPIHLLSEILIIRMNNLDSE